MALPGQSMDAVVITRRDSSTDDAEGNFSATATPVFSGAGTWGNASAQEQQVAAARGQTLDAHLIVPNGLDVRIGDQVTVRGAAWVVVNVVDMRIHQRLGLRQGVF